MPARWLSRLHRSAPVAMVVLKDISVMVRSQRCSRLYLAAVRHMQADKLATPLQRKNGVTESFHSCVGDAVSLHGHGGFRARAMGRTCRKW